MGSAVTASVPPERVRSLAEDCGLSLDDEELSLYSAVLEEMAGAFAEVADTTTPTFEGIHGSPDRYGDRDDGREPTDDPYNAWQVQFELAGAETGPLDGYSVGLKDSIAVASYECTLGTPAMAEFVPDIDATVVSRLLDAGGTLVGKQTMDAFAMGDAGEFQPSGPTLNPADDSRLAGGSSSGGAAAVAAGECDVAIGTDQAGSVRNPASWCGVIGLKPTYGLVPYTGIVPMDRGFDHAGIIASDPQTVADVLSVIAGIDRQNGVRLDPRQPSTVPTDSYDADTGPPDLTVGIVEEGFDWPFSAEAVDRCVSEALEASSWETGSVSLTHHRLSPAIVGATAPVGGATTLAGDGVGTDATGWHWEGLAQALGTAEQTPETLLPAVVAAQLFRAQIAQHDTMAGYARAKNLVLAAGRAYDAALEQYDLLALPTTPTTALEPADDRETQLARLGWLPANTGIFNQTGHPALSVPCGTVDGLPVGVELVAGRFEEETLLRAAREFC
ncbi:amidase family protein [Halovenus halobia]|uniref:amidase family protein n=1 Tax=Halovenus halobia TaxID=3396622 RepID=UPI003F56BE0F